MNAGLPLRSLATLAGLSVLVISSACGGGDPDFVGTYMTTSHVSNQTQCSGADTPIDAPPYFRITSQKFFGATVYTRDDCDSADQASCVSGGGLVDSTGVGFVLTQSGDASSCSLGYISYQAALDGDELTFSTTTYADSGAIDPCTTDEAEKRGDSMPCQSYDILVGTRVAN